MGYVLKSAVCVSVAKWSCDVKWLSEKSTHALSSVYDGVVSPECEPKGKVVEVHEKAGWS